MQRCRQWTWDFAGSLMEPGTNAYLSLPRVDTEARCKAGCWFDSFGMFWVIAGNGNLPYSVRHHFGLIGLFPCSNLQNGLHFARLSTSRFCIFQDYSTYAICFHFNIRACVSTQHESWLELLGQNFQSHDCSRDPSKAPQPPERVSGQDGPGHGPGLGSPGTTQRHKLCPSFCPESMPPPHPNVPDSHCWLPWLSIFSLAFVHQPCGLLNTFECCQQPHCAPGRCALRKWLKWFRMKMLLLHHLIPLQCKLYSVRDELIKPMPSKKASGRNKLSRVFSNSMVEPSRPFVMARKCPAKICGRKKSSVLLFCACSLLRRWIIPSLPYLWVASSAAWPRPTVTPCHTYHYPDTPCRCDEMGCAPYAHIAFWRSLGWSMMKCRSVLRRDMAPYENQGTPSKDWSWMHWMCMRGTAGSPLKCSSLSDHIWVLLLELLVPGRSLSHGMSISEIFQTSRPPQDYLVRQDLILLGSFTPAFMKRWRRRSAELPRLLDVLKSI